VRPKLLICDEPVSALDVSTRAGVVNLLQDLRDELGLSYLFIAHDLALTRQLCDRVAAMYKGEIVELSAVDDFFDRPQHWYTQSLLSCEAVADPVVQRQRRLNMKSASSRSD
jgi:ABC-type oligopeptide transport system ATPase subunit